MTTAEALALIAREHREHREAVSDEELARRAQQGDTDAFSLLVQRYQRGIANLAYRLVGHWDTALDLTQEVFVRTYQMLHTFDTRRSFKPWIYRIATNRCYDYLRQQGRRESFMREQDLSPRLPARDRAADPEDRVLQNEIRRAVEEVIASLPPHYRAVITLRYLEDMSYKEIAEALDMPMGTVKTHIHRARELLRTALENRGIRP